MSLLKQLNDEYLALHTDKEDAFWSAKMGLSDGRGEEFEEKEIRLKEFICDARRLPAIRSEREREDLTEEERVGLEGWLRFFRANAIESEEAKALQRKLVEMEGELERSRRDMTLGYVDPDTGEFRRAGSVALALQIGTSQDERIRRAAWEGLRSIETHVLENGFLEIVKERNRLGKILGYEDYYDYKVSVNEGFSKKKLFELLDDLELNTRDACRRSIDALRAEKGDAAVEAWNFDYNTSGDLKARTDPYHRFDDALERWGVSFAALGIRYSGANLTLDLVNRAGKHENGFMHGPGPTFTEGENFHPARINFTANAVPGQIGSGERAMNTLLHEGGHAAHFSNIRMPAPCFSQEFTPTSVAMAETQSMFLDSLMDDPDWLVRYARNEAGESMPEELILNVLEQGHKYRAHQIRRLLVVSYAEKIIYEMPEEELTPENVLNAMREVERRLLMQPAAGRPTLAIPHLIAGEASAYYHGYILAEMAVFQTRDYFLRRDGRLMDNPKIGRDLAENYWKPGNSRTFLEMIEDLTGEPFSARAFVDAVNMPAGELFAEARRKIAEEPGVPRHQGPVDLDAVITVVHGDRRIASTADGGGFEALSAGFAGWIRELEAAA